MPTTAGPGQIEAKSLELNLGLPCGWQEPNHLSRHLQPPTVHISSQLGLKVELGLELMHCGMRGSCPKHL